MSFWRTVRARLLSFGIVVSLGFLLLVTLLANALLAVMTHALTGYFALEVADTHCSGGVRHERDEGQRLRGELVRNVDRRLAGRDLPDDAQARRSDR